MKLVVKRNLKNNSYNVELSVIDITDTDRELISDFGEPVIDIGGVIVEDAIKEEFTKVQIQKTEPVLQDVLDEDGQPVLDGEGNPEQETVEVPVFDDEGNPVMIDKIGEDGKFIYEIKEVPYKEVVFELATKLRKFPSEFPIQVSFNDIEHDGKAEKIALAYIELMKTEIESKIAELKSKEDTFTDEEVYVLKVDKEQE